MICSKCGAAMPDNAEFCGECGASVIRKEKTSSAALIKARKEARMYKTVSIVLAVFCLIFLLAWAFAPESPERSLDKYEKEVVNIDRAGIELSGLYVVGEDKELPAGRYNIYPPEGESYVSVDIYDSMDKAKKKYDKDYNSLAIDHIYSMQRGYKLKEGQIIVMDSHSAFFELVEETVPGEDEQEALETTEGNEGEEGTREDT